METFLVTVNLWIDRKLVDNKVRFRGSCFHQRVGLDNVLLSLPVFKFSMYPIMITESKTYVKLSKDNDKPH